MTITCGCYGSVRFDLFKLWMFSVAISVGFVAVLVCGPSGCNLSHLDKKRTVKCFIITPHNKQGDWSLESLLQVLACSVARGYTGTAVHH